MPKHQQQADNEIHENQLLNFLVKSVNDAGFDDPHAWWGELILPVISNVVNKDEIDSEITHVPQVNQTLGRDDDLDDDEDETAEA